MAETAGASAVSAGAADASVVDADAVRSYLLDLQARIVAALEAAGGAPFLRDAWQRPEGGGGITRIVEGGDLFERGGVGFSHVRGSRLPPSASAHRPELAGRPWEAMGVSLVLHPRNPHVPTVHLNVRFFVAHPADGASVARGDASSAARAAAPAAGGADSCTGAAASIRPHWWFGGGMDLTPYYPHEADVVRFHAACRDALAPFGAGLHARFKKWCDEYFYLKHRAEPRGVGGIFFDDFSELGFADSFAMMRSVGDAFLPAYLPAVERGRDLPYGARERDFQAYRRGRYVEFNLVYDRGTLFGLQSGGRTESILMSMPPVVNWRYDWRPEPGSPEARLTDEFLVPRDWV